jgi:hypothetical protein
MTHRGILACVLLLCVASVADAQRLWFRPTIRPPAPRVTPAGGTHIGVGYHSTTVTSGGTSDGSGANDSWWSRWWWAVVLAGVVLGVILFCWLVGSVTEPEQPAKATVTPTVATNGPPIVVPPPAEAVLVRVVSMPAGEAPEWVRQAWVGLVLPAWENTAMRGRGVLTGNRSFAPAYQVSTAVALNLLELGNQTAAAEWWRANVPDANDPSERFLFDTSCCQRV